MKRKYYAVYTKLMEDPQALFQSLGWAKRFIKEQQKIWINAKFKIYEIKEIKL